MKQSSEIVELAKSIARRAQSTAAELHHLSERIDALAAQMEISFRKAEDR